MLCEEDWILFTLLEPLGISERTRVPEMRSAVAISHAKYGIFQLHSTGHNIERKTLVEKEGDER